VKTTSLLKGTTLPDAVQAPPLAPHFNPWGFFRGVFVPEAILDMETLSPGAKLCYGYLVRAAGKQGVCRSSYLRLARRMHVSREQLKRYVRVLRRLELIVSPPAAGGISEIRFLWHPVFAAYSPRGGSYRTQGGGHIRPRDRSDTTPASDNSLSTQEAQQVVVGQSVSNSQRAGAAFSSPSESTTTTTTTARQRFIALYEEQTTYPLEFDVLQRIEVALETKGATLAHFLDDITPRVKRLKRPAGPGFFLAQADRFGRLGSAAVVVAEQSAPEKLSEPRNRPPCVVCGHPLGSGVLLRAGKPEYCPSCETERQRIRQEAGGQVAESSSTRSNSS